MGNRCENNNWFWIILIAVIVLFGFGKEGSACTGQCCRNTVC